MKHLLSFPLLVFTFFVFGQTKPTLETPKDTVPQELFIPDAFLHKQALKKGQIEPSFVVWNSDGNELIQRLVDIRFVLSSNEEALKYHNAKLKENSENGIEVEVPFSFKNIEGFHAYKESPQMERMIKMMNLPQRQYFFLFVVGNVSNKVFIATHPDKKIEELQPIIQQAIDQILLFQQD